MKDLFRIGDRSVSLTAFELLIDNLRNLADWYKKSLEKDPMQMLLMKKRVNLSTSLIPSHFFSVLFLSIIHHHGLWYLRFDIAGRWQSGLSVHSVSLKSQRPKILPEHRKTSVMFPIRGKNYFQRYEMCVKGDTGYFHFQTDMQRLRQRQTTFWADSQSQSHKQTDPLTPTLYLIFLTYIRQDSFKRPVRYLFKVLVSLNAVSGVVVTTTSA